LAPACFSPSQITGARQDEKWGHTLHYELNKQDVFFPHPLVEF
jgi:hypothetical protein